VEHLPGLGLGQGHYLTSTCLILAEFVGCFQMAGVAEGP
jgi:hypothetical protein